MTAYEMKRFHERKHMNENYEDCLVVWFKPNRTSGNDYLYLCLADNDGPWGEKFDWTPNREEALIWTRTHAQEYVDRFNTWAKNDGSHSQFMVKEK